MRPDNVNALAEQILADEATAIKYLWNKNRQVLTAPTSCDLGCRKNIYCDIVAAEFLQNTLCKESLLTRF